MAWIRVLLAMCVLCVCSGHVNHNARVKATEGMRRFPFKTHSGFVKLVNTASRKVIYVDKNDFFYSIDSTKESSFEQVDVNLCEDKNNQSCEYRISLLTESADGNLFLCGFKEEAPSTKCCYMKSKDSLTDCFKVDNYKPNIIEPSLLIDDMLYFTLSEKGLYRINKDKSHNIWPMSTQTEQKYLKLIALKEQGKIYSFFAERHKSKDGESDQWIPRVSQNCMNDRGGPKSQLQSSWTSTIYARLSCGKHDFTQLIDVATLETDKHIKIYALFRNFWNMSSVCVYNMTEITRIFSSSNFNSTNVPAGYESGKCVEDSTRLNNEVLKFMMERPEMKDAVMPENGPLIFTHQHYSHIQVDRVRNQTVLLLSLESGGVHKVLEESVEKPVFVIAEYPAFEKEKIISTLLDTSEKRLYVSSSNDVVQIDLDKCEDYKDKCPDCMLSRDPYCGWNGAKCTSAVKNKVKNECSDSSVLAAKSIQTKTDDENPTVVYVPQSSQHLLLCPVMSHHATYHWQNTIAHKCIHSELGCLYLIESMNHTHEGLHTCVSLEGDYQRTVIQFKVSMIRSHALHLTPAVLHCLLLALHFL